MTQTSDFVYLQKRIGMLKEPTSYSVTSLMIGHRFLLFRVQNVALFFHAGHNTLDSLLKVLQLNRFV